MGEKKLASSKDGHKSYPVNVVAFRIGWIIRTEAGKDFLDEVLQSENLEYFNLQSMKMIIEFLYQKFKLSLLKYMLPLYIVQVVSLEYMIIMNERILCQLFQTEFPESAQSVMKFENETGHSNSAATTTLVFVIPVITLANLAWLYQLFLSVKNNGLVVFKQVKTWIPLIVVFTTYYAISAIL